VRFFIRRDDDMTKLAGLLFVANALLILVWWVYSGQPQQKAAFAFSGLAILVGLALTFQDRLTEFTIEGVGSIKAAAEQATQDAGQISELRKRIEAQSATVDLVAQEASAARKLGEEVRSRNEEAERKLLEVDDTLEDAKASLNILSATTQFAQTSIAAQNDDRKAFDELERMAEDPRHPFNKRAADVWRTVLDAHSPMMVVGGFTIPWQANVDPSKLDIAQIRSIYASAPVWLRPAFAEYISQRTDLSKKDRMTLLIGIVRNDDSLKAVEYAGREFAKAAGINIKPIAAKPMLDWWDANKDSIQ